jgi:DNA-binding transcriptional LysR family regulator
MLLIYFIDMSIEAFSFDQIRVFLTVAETGTFSAAGKALGRVQSAISYAINNLEDALQVQLFDRSQKRPQLTEAGRQLLADAKAVDLKMQGLQARAKGMSLGLEANLSIGVDVLFPMDVIAAALSTLNQEYPSLAIELHTESLGATAQLLLNNTCQLAIVGPLLPEHDSFELHPLKPLLSLPVCAPSHPLANTSEPVTQNDLADFTQLVLSDRSELTKNKDFGVLSVKSWRLSDIGAKQELLRAGLGWGFLPEYMARQDLSNEDLVEIDMEVRLLLARSLTCSVAYRRDRPPGPGGQRLMQLLIEAPLP